MPAGQTSEQFRTLFDQSLEMLAIAADGFLVTVNPAWTALLGWTEKELTTNRLLTFVHPDDVSATEDAMRDLTAGRSASDFRNRLRHKDGNYRSILWSLRPEGDLVYVGARDISIDAELRDRAERSEAVALGILRTAADPIVVIDTEGIIVEANGATTDLFGYRSDELLGANVNILMPEPYRSEHDGYLARYLSEGDPRIIGIGREVEARRADGTTFPMALAVSEVKTEHDHLFTGVIHDLTERNRQRDDLQRANTELEARVAERTSRLENLLEELRRSNRDLEQFAYVASHDLQAPLRNVRQGLELLDEHLEASTGSGFDDEALELRDLVISAVLRMEALIKGLLAYSRVQRNPMSDRELLDMNEVVGEVVEILRPDVSNVSGAISIGSLPRLHGNAVQLRQVFQNLIENSIRYRSAERDLRIEIATRDIEGSRSTITVTDNGTGIEETHHERIFELFRRGHSGYDGVGLGLAICQRIIEGHGGRMWVESVEGEGATFCISLPVLADE